MTKTDVLCQNCNTRVEELTCCHLCGWNARNHIRFEADIITELYEMKSELNELKADVKKLKDLLIRMEGYGIKLIRKKQ